VNGKLTAPFCAGACAKSEDAQKKTTIIDIFFFIGGMFSRGLKFALDLSALKMVGKCGNSPMR
jgi:hypothetical protein